MTYGDSGYRDETRFRGEPGFREETDFRSDSSLSTSYTPGGYSMDDYSSTGTDTTVGLSRRSVTASELNDVFDDPQHGEPGMDRMAFHVVWDLLLIVAAVAAFVLLRQTHSNAVSGSGLRGLLLDAATLGLITIGMALSLRAAAVNLAVGPIASACAYFFAEHSDRNLAATAGVTVLLALGLGVVIAILVVGFHVPAWAASLAGGLVAIVWVQEHANTATNQASYHPDRQAYYWFGAFAALSLLGGVFGLIKPVRRAVGRFRSVGDPASRRGAGAGFVAFIAIIGSCAFAAAGGVLAGLSSPAVTPAADGLLTTGLALGAALAGGTSAFGRRGGVFGTMAAVTLLTLLMHYGVAADLKIAPYAWAAGAIIVGLVVTRMVERFGRPRAEDDEDMWSGSSSSGMSSNGWSSSSRQGGWSSQLPARPLDDTWSGAEDRWRAR
jgi:ribose/xylose/arabinose/galactoside ABC-type transport system permease subunit